MKTTTRSTWITVIAMAILFALLVWASFRAADTQWSNMPGPVVPVEVSQ